MLGFGGGVLKEEVLDLAYMQEVERVYLDTVRDRGEGSIKETARVMGIARTKVKKILITLGTIESPLTEEVLREIQAGTPLRAISRETGISMSTLSTYIPYKTALHDGEIKTREAIRKQRYRAYVNSLLEKVNSVPEELRKINREWVEEAVNIERKGFMEEMDRIKKVDQYLGAIDDRDKAELGDLGLMEGVDRTFDLVRLHLEMEEDYFLEYHNTKRIVGESDEAFRERVRSKASEVLRVYGGVQYGHTISRDIIVPMDITLHALHYVIQKAFGWQNAHLHSFTIPDRFLGQLLKGGVMDWCKLVGILFASPYVDEDAQFWDDDFEGGSLKTWLRKKYTGPYFSLSRAESYAQCAEEIEEFIERHRGERYVVEYGTEISRIDGIEATEPSAIGCYPVSKKQDLYYQDREKHIRGYFTKEMSFEELPYNVLDELTFEANYRQLLERLTIGEVMAFGDRQLIDETHPMDVCEYIITDCDALLDEVQKTGDLESFIEYDAPDHQPRISSVTDTLLYEYDFGDSWQLKITGSFNCVDLVEAGRVTQEELDAAMTTVWKTYRPVCIASDGINLMDDVGGLSGFKSFLQDINIDARKATEEEAENKAGLLEWASELGWSKRKSALKNLL